MAPSLPSNVTIASHPCIAAKLSQLRSASASPRETKLLVHELSLILATEALGKHLVITTDGKDVTPLGFEYNVERASVRGTSQGKVVLVPILRSGLGMVDGAFRPFFYIVPRQRANLLAT